MTLASKPDSKPRIKEQFRGTGVLLKFMLRRDRVKLPAWVGGLGLFVIYVVSALPNAYKTQEELAAAVSIYADPVGRMLIGPGYGFDNPSIQQFVANGYGLYFMILAALMSMFLIARHTRVEEQTGRAELIRANVVGRYAALTAAIGVAIITNALAAFIIFLLMIGMGGFDLIGSLLFAVSIGAVGLAFAGITTVTVQLSEYSKIATGLAGMILGAAFVVRAGGDMMTEGGSALSWLSPLGWAQQTAPFVLDRWWPLIFLLILAVITICIGYRLLAYRDLGASLLAARPGPAQAKPSLGTPLGLALRLQRSSIIGWAAALAVSGVVFGAFADGLLSATSDMPEVFTELLGSGEGLLAGYFGYMAMFMAYLAGTFAILAIQGVRNEETSGRAEPVLATGIGRTRWLGSNVLVTIYGIVLLMFVAGIATGIGAALVTGSSSYIIELALAHLNQVPAVLVLLGVAAFLFGIFPRAIMAAWALLGFSVFIGTFGKLFNVPELFNLSPFNHLANMPLEQFELKPVLILTTLAFVLLYTGLSGLKRRAINAK